MQRFSMPFSAPTTVSFSFLLSSAFACYHSPWFSELTLCMPLLCMPHHATLCSSYLNCQSNFRLKVFLLFLTPTAVSFFFYSFFCFCMPAFSLIFWTGSLLCLLYTCHLMQRCVPAVVFQQSFSSSRVPAVVFQHSFPAVVFQHLFPEVMFQHSFSSSRVPAVVFQLRVPAVVFQLRVPAVVF